MTTAAAEIAELPTDPGARLRRQREKSGLSEQEVAERLNLDVGAILALEQDSYASLGAPVFARGHLRRYASLVGLAGEEIVGAYDRSRAQLAQPSLIPAWRVEMVPMSGRPMWPWLAAGAILFLAAAGAAGYVSYYGVRLPGAAASSVDVTRSAPAVVVDDREHAVGVRGPAEAMSPDSRSPEPVGAALAAAVPPDQVRLVFDFSGDSWVEVYDGTGKAVLYDLGRAGTRSVVAGEAPLSVTLGSPSAVTVAVNGQRVAVPVPPTGQAVARFGIGRSGLLR